VFLNNLKFFFLNNLKFFFLKKNNNIVFVFIFLSILIFLKIFLIFFKLFFINNSVNGWFIYQSNINKNFYLVKIMYNINYNVLNFLRTLNFINNDLYYNYVIFINSLMILFKLKFFFYINNLYIYITLIYIQIFLLILSIWTRACGPRVRIDQLSYLTWKEFLINLFLIITVLFFFYIFI
jgi:hypothetical protein